MTNLEHALCYQVRGWSVIPLRYTGDADELKRPLIPSWDEYKTTPASKETVTQWWTEHPEANVGLVMGAVSGLVAIDLDGPKAQELLYERVGHLAPTLMVKTGKGIHLLFKYPGEKVGNKVRLISDDNGSGVDVRGDGGYIVAPPSLHGNGSRYFFIGEEIAPLPPALLNLINGGGGRLVAKEEMNAGWVDEAMKGVSHGERNDTAAKLAGYWLRETNSEKATWRLLLLWNRGNRPPMPEWELSRTFVSILTKHQADKGEAVTGKGLISATMLVEEVRDLKPREGIPVNVPGFNIIGGLVRGDLIVMGGRPGMGKSTLACQLAAETAILHKAPTLVISSEMTRYQWFTWMLMSREGITEDQIIRPIPDTILKPWREAPFFITDRGTISVEEIRAMAGSIPNLRLVIVDHLTRITTGKRDLRYLEVGDTARSLKNLAKDKECTVLALAHISRAIEHEKRRPRLSDLRESGDIEQEADSVFFLWLKTPGMQSDITPMCIALEKNRHGALRDTEVVFDKRIKRFMLSSEVLYGQEQENRNTGEGDPTGPAETLPGELFVRGDDGFIRPRVAAPPESVQSGVSLYS